MPSRQQVVAGVALLAAGASLSGCGSADTTAPPGPAPNPIPDSIPYDQAELISTFGSDTEFLWGSATAAAQIEGAWNVSGKQPSIWDDFCHSIRAITGDTTANPFHKDCGKFPAGADQERWTTLDVTDDFYHKYEDDLQMLADYNMNALRISLSWPRLMPYNATTGQHEPNPAAIDFYNAVLDKMIELHIKPVVALFHWDLPNDLSFLQDSVVEEFAKYADLAFTTFGSKIKDWVTFNEPTSICSLGYSIGAFAPGHQSTTDHLVCGKNLLLAHARAVQIFREAAVGDSQIGIVLDYKWTYPQTVDPKDDEMAQWDRDNVIGFWADPIFGSGDFPQSLKTFYGDKMPVLSPANQTLLRNSADFYGANTYGGKITKSEAYSKTLANYSGGDDMAERYSFCPCNDGENRDAVIDPTFECGAASGWLWARADSMFQYLNYITTTYDNPKIYVTEFGGDVEGEGEMTFTQAKPDEWRVKYYQLYMMQIAKAKNAGSNIKGVFAWSLMDNFEWGDGLDFRFGITYVDFNDPTLPRSAKDSAIWWTQLIGNMSSSESVVVA